MCVEHRQQHVTLLAVLYYSLALQLYIKLKLLHLLQPPLLPSLAILVRSEYAVSMALGIFFYAECEDRRHLRSSKAPSRESCFTCEKPLGHNADIYMYRGNTPFCTPECRLEQIEMDDAEERRRRKQSAHRTKSESTRSTAGNKYVRTDSIRVA